MINWKTKIYSPSKKTEALINYILEAQKNKIMGAITKRRKEVNILSPQGADRFVADIIEIIKNL